jgi:Tol biopolymer transport system component
MRSSIAAILFSILVSANAAMAADEDRKWPSPDKSLIAEAVISTEPDRSDLNWDLVKIDNKDGVTVASLSLKEGTGINRALVEDTAWSPDSRFFVFTTSSSGGHSIWHMPTYFYDRRSSLIYSVDDSLSAVASSNRKLIFASNDTLELEFYNFENSKDSDPYSFLKSVCLPDLVKGHAKIAAHSWHSSSAR